MCTPLEKSTYVPAGGARSIAIKKTVWDRPGERGKMTPSDITREAERRENK